MPEEHQPRRKSGDTCHIAGWGRLKYHGALAQTLQELEVGIIANKDCTSKVAYGKFSGYPVVDDHMFCAGHMSGGKDACSGQESKKNHLKILK